MVVATSVIITTFIWSPTSISSPTYSRISVRPRSARTVSIPPTISPSPASRGMRCCGQRPSSWNCWPTLINICSSNVVSRVCVFVCACDYIPVADWLKILVVDWLFTMVHSRHFLRKITLGILIVDWLFTSKLCSTFSWEIPIDLVYVARYARWGFDGQSPTCCSQQPLHGGLRRGTSFFVSNVSRLYELIRGSYVGSSSHGWLRMGKNILYSILLCVFSHVSHLKRTKTCYCAELLNVSGC